MTIAVRCPHCSHPHDVPEESLGKQATCQGCGQRFTLEASHDETVAYVQGRAKESDGAAARRAAQRAKIGRYEIRERLGAGVFGTVYRAYDAVLDRDVALKVPQAAALDSADARERFLREARAAGKLRHPHIVPVYDCGQEGDEVFIVAAFIEGKTLAAALAAGQVDRRRAVSIVAKLAHALGTAHQAGIVHRDVKPANVMLDERGEPQLTDFGLAQLGSTSHLTQQGMVLGTPAYMSPEQALGDQSQVGPANDQYSLGVMLYEMLCGRVPFDGPPLTVLYRVRDEPPVAPRSIDPTISAALEAICLRAMEKRPTERFGDCAALADALRQVDFDAARAEQPRAPAAAVAPAKSEPPPTAAAPTRPAAPAKSLETAREPAWQKAKAPPRPAAEGGAFDAYHKWLAIPLAERPPTHYQLLAVAPSETDRDVLNTAALQRSAYVRNFQAGKHGELATRILNEIAAALACVLDPARRAAYDAELRKTRPRAAESKSTVQSRPAASAAALSPLLDPGLLAAVAAEPLAPPVWMAPPPPKRTGLPWWGVASAVGGVAVLVLVAMIALSGGDPPAADPGDVPLAAGTGSGAAASAAAPDDAAPAADVVAADSQPEDASSTTPLVTETIPAEPDAGSPDPTDTAGNAAGSIAVAAGPSSAVPPPWPADAVEFEEHRYKVFYEQLTWRQAKTKCEEMGGRLPIVTSRAENDFLVELFRRGMAAPAKLDGLWLGATDEAREGTWLWVDGTPLKYRNWAQGQPNNKQASEHFLLLNVGRDGDWSDQPNASTQARTFYACEWDAPATDDTAVTSLFDGATLQGWEGNPAVWRVENGAIVGHKPAGAQGDTYLMTRASFDNFVLTTKFRLLEGNSGVQFRGEPFGDDGMTGYSADLAYHDNFKYLGWLFLAGQPAPFAAPTAAQKQRVIAALDEGGWNEYRITADGNHIVLAINDVEVVNTRHDGPTRGRIGFQLHGGTTATRVEFKDIEIRELPEDSAAATNVAANAPPVSTPDEEDGFTSLFNGTDLAGWRVIGGPRQGWVQGGLLVSDGAMGDLATEGEYSDFELSLEFRIGRNANSGIFLRAADGDMNAQDCAEVQIYDDSTATDTPPVQRTGSIYNLVAASPPSTAPPGQWQTMVIRMQGTTVRVTLDDTVRVNADLTRYRDRLKGYVNRRRGYIKLQHHRGRVEFRNIRIRELTAAVTGATVPQPAIVPQPEIVPLRELPNPGANQSAPWLSDDGLTLYWKAPAEGDTQSWIWTAHRDTPDGLFKNAARLAPGNDPTLTSDGLAMVLLAKDALEGCTRPSLAGAFPRPAAISELKPFGFLASPCLIGDGLTLYADQIDFEKSSVQLLKFLRPNRAAPWQGGTPVRFAGAEERKQRFFHVTADGARAFSSLQDMPGDWEDSLLVAWTYDQQQNRFESPRAIVVSGDRVRGKFPRYVAATRELFFARRRAGANFDEIVAIRNFDPTMHTEPLEATSP